MTNGSVSRHRFESLLHAHANTPFLSAEEEAALVLRVRGGDARAVDRLTKAHMRFVFSIADQFRRYGTPFDELVSEALLGFMEALRRYDPQRGPRLASYSALWMRALLRRYTLNNRRIVRPPSSRAARKVIGNAGHVRQTLTQRLGQEPNAAQIARELGVAVTDVEQVGDVMSKRDVVCDAVEMPGVHQPISPSPSPEALVAEHEVERQRSAAIARALVQLSPRERLVVAQRALVESPRKLEDIGTDLGVSRERVRQIQNDAFAKMRIPLAAVA
jgi:RNA polymerase sigma-32 factor